MPRRLVLDSDEEDEMDRREPVTIHDSDSESEDSDDSDDGPGNQFLDDMADDDEEEDEDDEEGNDESSQAEEGSDEEDEDAPRGYPFARQHDNRHAKFHPFIRLPIELRMKIWEHYCPDLTSNGRVLRFLLNRGSAFLMPDTWNMRHRFLTIWDARELSDQTYHLRHVMAVHKESRQLASRLYPDSVKIDGGEGTSQVRVSRDRDVFFLEHWSDVELDVMNVQDHQHMASFTSTVENIAVYHHSVFEFGNTTTFASWLDNFPNLRHLFVCVAPKVFREKQITSSADMEWCLSEYANRYVVETWAKENGTGEDYSMTYCWPDAEEHKTFATVHVPRIVEERMVGPGADDALKEKGVGWWPMAMFPGYGDKFLQPRGGRGDSDDDEEDDSDGEFDETNEYESDGIDDAENPEIYDSDDGLPDDADITAQFSNSEYAESSPVVAKKSRKRRVVEDDSDEEEAGPSTGRKRARIVLDSDDEKEKSVLIISDDSDDEPVVKKRKPKRVVEESEDEDEEESEEEEPRRVTLAQRLKGKSKKAVVISDEEDDEEEEEEEEEEEDDDDEEDDSDGGFIDNAALESDGEDEEEDGDESYY